MALPEALPRSILAVRQPWFIIGRTSRAHDRLDSSAKWRSQGFKSYGVGLRGLSTLDRYGKLTALRHGELDVARSGRMN